MRELVSCVRMAKPIIALIEPDTKHGGLTRDEIAAQLVAAVASYDKWGFATDTPRGDELYSALFWGDPIEWNRIVTTYYLLLTTYYLLLTA